MKSNIKVLLHKSVVLLKLIKAFEKLFSDDVILMSAFFFYQRTICIAKYENVIPVSSMKALFFSLWETVF